MTVYVLYNFKNFLAILKGQPRQDISTLDSSASKGQCYQFRIAWKGVSQMA